MTRYLALDYGRKRVGVAVSDPLGLTSQPVGYLIRDGSILTNLAKLCEEREVNEIVVGYPRNLNGTPSDMAREVEAFAEEIKAKIPLPLHFWDERLTTAESEKLLISADMRRSKRKEVRDQIAAALILQGFLQSRRT